MFYITISKHVFYYHKKRLVFYVSYLDCIIEHFYEYHSYHLSIQE